MRRRDALALVDTPVDELCAEARALRRSPVVTYSPKVFIPLTKLCRDVCHYCTFARPPRRGERAYLREDEVLEIARAGAAAGCHEALFTLGDKPELRYRAAREELAALGCETTLEYLARCARLVLEETGLLPHLNPGVMTRDDLAALREGQRLAGDHARDRVRAALAPRRPALRLARQAPRRPARDDRRGRRGARAVHHRDPDRDRRDPSRADRGPAGDPRAARAPRPRPGGDRPELPRQGRGRGWPTRPSPRSTSCCGPPPPPASCCPPDVHVQAPPNLSYDDFPRLLEAGIDDWGGISPVTIDHVNPEAPWPEIERLARGHRARRGSSSRRGSRSTRSSSTPSGSSRRCVTAALRRADADGLGREDRWAAGRADARFPFVPRDALPRRLAATSSARTRSCACSPRAATRPQRVFAAADALRREVCGDEVTYVVTRNVNYTNVCYFRCGFCAFSKGKLAEDLRGKPYLVPARRDRPPRGGGLGARRRRDLPPGRDPPRLHRRHLRRDLRGGQGRGARTSTCTRSRRSRSGRARRRSGVDLDSYLARLRDAGLASLPGTAAEILDDEVRAVICPDKVSTEQWLSVHDAAHEAGLRSTTTIMFGHVEGAALLGAAPARAARAAAPHRRLHRVRAAAVRAHGGADLPARPGAAGPDLPRGAADARGRPARAAPVDHERPGLVGEARPRRRAGRPAGGRERPRRHAHERVDLARGRGEPRAGGAARGARGGDPRARPHASPALDPVRRAAGRAGRHARSALRRSRSRSTRASTTPV